MYTIIKYIRVKYNIIIFNYLDVILILAVDFHKCESRIQIVIKELQNLGWQNIIQEICRQSCTKDRVFGSFLQSSR